MNDFNWAACSGGKAPCDPTANLQCGKSYRYINIHYALPSLLIFIFQLLMCISGVETLGKIGQLVVPAAAVAAVRLAPLLLSTMTI